MGIERNTQSIPKDFNVLPGVAAAGFYRFECVSNIKIPIAAFCRLKKSVSLDYVERYGSRDMGCRTNTRFDRK